MANFVIIVDRDAKRRARFIEVITPLLAPVDGLNTSSCASGGFHAGWAALPLDRNLNDTFPIRPRFRWLLAWYLFRRPIHALRQSLHRGEQRYYYRIYDINNPGWVAIRRQAEPYRGRVAQLFNMDVLSELLPPPGVPLNLKDSLRDASGRKTLLGLLLWAHEYLS